MTDCSLFTPCGIAHQGAAFLKRSFTPLSVTPSLWYDETFGVTSSGGDLTGWQDKSGNGYHASVGDSAFSYSSNTITSLSGDSMIFTPLTARTIFAVLEVLSFPSLSLSALVSDTGSPTNGDYVFWHGSTSYAVSLDGGVSRTGSYRKNGATDLTGLNVGTSAIAVNTPHIIAIRYSTTPNQWKTLNKFVAINSGSPTSFYGNFKWRQFLLFDRNVATNEIEMLEGWAAHLYGIANKLPSNHPYKNIAP